MKKVLLINMSLKTEVSLKRRMQGSINYKIDFCDTPLCAMKVLFHKPNIFDLIICDNDAQVFDGFVFHQQITKEYGRRSLFAIVTKNKKDNETIRKKLGTNEIIETIEIDNLLINPEKTFDNIIKYHGPSA